MIWYGYVTYDQLCNSNDNSMKREFLTLTFAFVSDKKKRDIKGKIHAALDFKTERYSLPLWILWNQTLDGYFFKFYWGTIAKS